MTKPIALGIVMGATLLAAACGDGGTAPAPNRSPVASGSIAARTVAVGESVTVSVASAFSDPDGDAMTLTATSSAPGVATAAASGTDVTVTGVSAGTATVTVTATDPDGLSAQLDFAVTVPNRAPEATDSIPDVEVFVGNTAEVDVSEHFTDPDGDALTHTAESSASGVASVAVSGTDVTVTGISAGTATVTVTATDPGGLSAQQAFEVTVPNRAPETADTIPDVELFVGDTSAVSVSDNFSDPDGDSLTFAASTSDAGVAEVSVSGSMVTVLAVAQGSATVTVTATDPGGLSAEQAFEVMVPNRAPEAADTIPDVELFVGDTAAVSVSDDFSDPDGDSLTFAAYTSDAGVAEVSVSGSTVTVLAVAHGSATVTVTATDPGGLSAEQAFEVTVPNRAPEAADTIPDVELFVGDTAAVSVSDDFSDPDGDSLTFTASTSDAGVAVVSVSGSTVSVAAVAPGLATVTVTASDPGGLSAQQAFEVTVPNRAPEATDSIPNVAVQVDDEFVLDAASYFTDPDGDRLEYSALSSDRRVAVVGVEGSTLTLTGVAKGSTTVTVTARDPGGMSAEQAFGVTVSQRNLAPRVVRRIRDLDADPGTVYYYLLSRVFEDPDGDPLTYVPESTNNNVADPEVVADTLFVETGSAGSATIRVTATDPGGLSAVVAFEVTVVVDFDLDVRVTDAVTEAQRARLRAARDEWERVLKNTELSNVSLPDEVTCHGITATGLGVVDDHVALVHVGSIDGQGGTLAQAGYCYIRLSNGIPVLSTVIFDEDDIDRVLSRGSLTTLAFHEFAHGLGFTDYYWDNFDLVDKGDDPHFEGKLATQAFDAAGGTQYQGAKVPISSPDYAHWRESVFGHEVMSPQLAVGVKTPISAITLQAMADVGYKVDLSRADDYGLPGTGAIADIARPETPGESFDLANDVVHGPVMVLDSNGQVVRVRPPPQGAVVPSFPWSGRRIEIGGLSNIDDIRQAPVRETGWRLAVGRPLRLR